MVVVYPVVYDRHVDARAVDALSPDRFDIDVRIVVNMVLQVPLAHVKRVACRSLAFFYEGVVRGVLACVERVARG